MLLKRKLLNGFFLFSFPLSSVIDVQTSHILHFMASTATQATTTTSAIALTAQSIVQQLDDITAQRQRVLGNALTRYSKPLLSPAKDLDRFYLLEFCDDHMLAMLAAVNASFFQLVEHTPKFIGKTNGIILDNTGSMDATCQKMQQDFVQHYLQGLHPRAMVAIRLVFRSAEMDRRFEGELAPLKTGCRARQALDLLPKLFSETNTAFRFLPSFYSGHSTPLYASICDPLTEGMDSVLVLTDGQDNVAEDFSSMNLYGKPLSTHVDQHNQTHAPKRTQKNHIAWPTGRKRKGSKSNKSNTVQAQELQALMKAISVSAVHDKVFLPCIVGLNTQPADSLGLLPVYSLTPGQDLRAAARRIRTATVPHESGGGYRSSPGILLRDRRYRAVNDRVRAFVRTDWQSFPLSDTMHCTSLLTEQRKSQLVAQKKDSVALPNKCVDILNRDWALPTERKGSWYFSYQTKQRPVAQKELEKTRERALQQFVALSPQHMQTLVEGAAAETFKRYQAQCVGGSLSSKSDKSASSDKSVSEPASKKLKIESSPNKTKDKMDTDDDFAPPETTHTINTSNTLCVVAQPNSKKRKREEQDQEPKSDSDSESKKEKETKETKKPKRSKKVSGQRLTEADFRIILGPGSLQQQELRKRVPTAFYPITVATFFWLLQRQAGSGLTLHDTLLIL